MEIRFQHKSINIRQKTVSGNFNIRHPDGTWDEKPTSKGSFRISDSETYEKILTTIAALSFYKSLDGLSKIENKDLVPVDFSKDFKADGYCLKSDWVVFTVDNSVIRDVWIEKFYESDYGKNYVEFYRKAKSRDNRVIIKEIIEDLETRLGCLVPISDVVGVAYEKGMDKARIDKAIEKLRRSGDIYEPSKGFLKRI